MVSAAAALLELTATNNCEIQANFIKGALSLEDNPHTFLDRTMKSWAAAEGFYSDEQHPREPQRITLHHVMSRHQVLDFLWFSFNINQYVSAKNWRRI